MTGTGTCISASFRSDFNDMMAVYEGECGKLKWLHQDMNCIEVVKRKVTWNSQNGMVYRIFTAGFEDIVSMYNLSILVCIRNQGQYVSHF